MPNKMLERVTKKIERDLQVPKGRYLRALDEVKKGRKKKTARQEKEPETGG